MARLIIKRSYTSHPDPATDRAGRYKPGDVVRTLPDGHMFGSREGLPDFWVVDVEAPLDELRYLEQSEYVAIEDPPTTVLTRRLSRIDMSALRESVPIAAQKNLRLFSGLSSTPLLDRLERDGSAVLHHQNLTPAIKQKVNGV